MPVGPRPRRPSTGLLSGLQVHILTLNAVAHIIISQGKIVIQLALIKQYHARGSAVIANIIMDGWIMYSFKKSNGVLLGKEELFRVLEKKMKELVS